MSRSPNNPRVLRLREMLTPEEWGARVTLLAQATEGSGGVRALYRRVGLPLGRRYHHGRWDPTVLGTTKLLVPSGCPWSIFTGPFPGFVQWLRATFPEQFPRLEDSP